MCNMILSQDNVANRKKTHNKTKQNKKKKQITLGHAVMTSHVYHLLLVTGPISWKLLIKFQ